MNQDPQMGVEITLTDSKGVSHTYEMPITWTAAKRLNAAGISPTGIVLKGEKYEMPEMELVTAVYVGITEAGAKWTVDEIGESMMKVGFLHFEIPIALYMTGFGTGGVTRKHRAAAEEAAGDGKKKDQEPDGTGSETATKSPSADGASPPETSGPSPSPSGGGSSTPSTPEVPEA